MTRERVQRLTVSAGDPAAAQLLLAELDTYLDRLYPQFAGIPFELAKLRPPAGYFAIAHDDGAHLLGCAGFRCMAGYAEIKRVYVATAHARRGVARALFAHLEDRIRAEGFPIARLETGTQQPAAIACFTALGYHPCEPFGGYEAHGISLFFEKQL